MFELLESFCKQIVPPLTEHDDVIKTQTKNCMRSQIAHAAPLHCHSGIRQWEKNEDILLTSIFEVSSQKNLDGSSVMHKSM